MLVVGQSSRQINALKFLYSFCFRKLNFITLQKMWINLLTGSIYPCKTFNRKNQRKNRPKLTGQSRDLCLLWPPFRHLLVISSQMSFDILQSSIHSDPKKADLLCLVLNKLVALVDVIYNFWDNSEGLSFVMRKGFCEEID